MTCAFDNDTFDSVSFDTCVPVAPSIPSIGGGGISERQKVIVIRPMSDDDDVLLAYSMLEEIL